MARKTASLLLIDDQQPIIKPVPPGNLSLPDKARLATTNLELNKKFKYFLVEIESGNIIGAVCYARLTLGGPVAAIGTALQLTHSISIEGTPFIVGSPVVGIRSKKPHVNQLLNILK